MIIVALRDELDAVLAHLPNAQQVTFPQADKRTYWVADVEADTDRPYRIAVTLLPQMGNIEAALAANDAIHLWRPNAIVVVGIAGGLRRGAQNFGDVVIASQVFYYEEQKLTEFGPETRPRMFEPARQLLDRALNYRGDPWLAIPASVASKVLVKAPRVFIAPIASGEKVFASAKAIDLLRKFVPKVAAVEMETAGVAAAALAAVRHTDVLVVRGISDFADAAKDDHARHLAAATAAAWTFGFEPDQFLQMGWGHFLTPNLRRRHRRIARSFSTRCSHDSTTRTSRRSALFSALTWMNYQVTRNRRGFGS